MLHKVAELIGRHGELLNAQEGAAGTIKADGGMKLHPPAVGDCDEPSDVVQDTQLEAFRRLADYCRRRALPFRLWLRKTAQERLLMARRQHLGAGRRSVGREVPLPEESSFQLLASSWRPARRPAVEPDPNRLPGADRQCGRPFLRGADVGERIRRDVVGVVEQWAAP
jgi:hypothetical protein